MHWAIFGGADHLRPYKTLDYYGTIGIGGMNMKQFKCTFICLCLLSLLIALAGCSNSNSADEFDGYYQVGETFTVSHSDKVEYEFTILEFTDEFFTVQVSKKALTEDADIYIYS